MNISIEKMNFIRGAKKFKSKYFNEEQSESVRLDSNLEKEIINEIQEKINNLDLNNENQYTSQINNLNLNTMLNSKLDYNSNKCYNGLQNENDFVEAFNHLKLTNSTLPTFNYIEEVTPIKDVIHSKNSNDKHVNINLKKSDNLKAINIKEKYDYNTETQDSNDDEDELYNMNLDTVDPKTLIKVLSPKSRKDYYILIYSDYKKEVIDQLKALAKRRGYGRPKKTKWSIDDFEIGKSLGKGSFGTVFLAREKYTKFIVAIKIIPKEMMVPYPHQLKMEIEALANIKHPNIIHLYNWFWDEEKVYLIMEYIDNGTLHNLIENYMVVPQILISKILGGIVSALQCCINNNIMHR